MKVSTKVWIIGLILTGVVLGLLRGSGIILGSIPTVLIAIGCVTVTYVIGKNISDKKENTEDKKDDSENEKKE